MPWIWSEGNLVHITALLHPPIPSSKKKKKKSISQVFVQLWLLRPMAGDSHFWVARVEALVGAERMCRGVSCTCASWWLRPLQAGDVRERGVARGSVQSQEWLRVLILPLLLMFQGPSFYHRLRSNNRGRKKTQLQTIYSNDHFGTLEGIQILCPLINQDTQNNCITSPPFLSLFSVLLCLLHHIAIERGILESSLWKSLLLVEGTCVLATTLPQCLNIRQFLRSIKSNKFCWIFTVSKHFLELLFLKVIGNLSCMMLRPWDLRSDGKCRPYPLLTEGSWGSSYNFGPLFSHL